MQFYFVPSRAGFKHCANLKPKTICMTSCVNDSMLQCNRHTTCELLVLMISQLWMEQREHRSVAWGPVIAHLSVCSVCFC